MSCDRRAFLVDSANEVSLGDPTNPSGSGGLIDESTGDYVATATVTLEAITDEATGDDLSGTLSLPIAMPYLAGSNGVYSASVPIGAAVAVGQEILMRIEVVDNAVLSRVFTLRAYGEQG